MLVMAMRSRLSRMYEGTSTARVDRRWSQVDRRWLGEISITARELLGDASRRIDVSGARLAVSL